MLWSKLQNTINRVPCRQWSSAINLPAGLDVCSKLRKPINRVPCRQWSSAINLPAGLDVCSKLRKPINRVPCRQWSSAINLQAGLDVCSKLQNIRQFHSTKWIVATSEVLKSVSTCTLPDCCGKVSRVQECTLYNCVVRRLSIRYTLMHATKLAECFFLHARTHT